MIRGRITKRQRPRPAKGSRGRVHTSCSPRSVLGTRNRPRLPEQGRPSVRVSESESLLSRGQQGDLACGSRGAKNSLGSQACCRPPSPACVRVCEVAEGGAWPAAAGIFGAWLSLASCPGGEEPEGGRVSINQSAEPALGCGPGGPAWSRGRSRIGHLLGGDLQPAACPLVSVFQVRKLTCLFSGCGAGLGTPTRSWPPPVHLEGRDPRPRPLPATV